MRDLLNKTVYFEREGKICSGTVEMSFTSHDVPYVQVGLDGTMALAIVKVDDCYLSEEEILQITVDEFERQVAEKQEVMFDLFMLLENCYRRLPDKEQEDRVFKEAMKRQAKELAGVGVLDI